MGSDIESQPGDGRIGLLGLAGLVETGGLWAPYRLPESSLPLIHPDLLARVKMPAGGRFSFTTDARRVELAVRTWPIPRLSNDGAIDPVSPFDFVVDGELRSRQSIEGEGMIVLDGLGHAMKDVEIWLPQFGEVHLGALRLSDANTVKPHGESLRRWILYGSSISQCKGAAGPSETWPALVARENQWDLRCLGFGGQCHLDPVVARYIRDTPAGFIGLCLGINIYGAGTFTARSLGPAVAGFILTVRDGHPTAPLVVMTPITSPSRETTPNPVGLTLGNIREIIEETVATFRAAGDDQLKLIPGPEAFGPEDEGLLADGLHPTDAGYRLMASRLSPRLHVVCN